MDYKKLYHLLMDASEKAIEAIDNGEPQKAKALLIEAELSAEDLYIAQD